MNFHSALLFAGLMCAAAAAHAAPDGIVDRLTRPGDGAGDGDAVKAANASARPLATFLRILDSVGGYREDPHRKKSSLLAAILSQRPEAFLRFGEGEEADWIDWGDWVGWVDGVR